MNNLPIVPGNNFWSRRRWLARLSFSFLIIAVFLGYTAYRGDFRNHELSHGRVMLHLIAAMLAFVLFCWEHARNIGRNKTAMDAMILNHDVHTRSRTRFARSDYLRYFR